MLLKEDPEPTPGTAPLRRVEYFAPGHLRSCAGFWQQEILSKHTEAERSKKLGWVRGVDVHEFIYAHATGMFLGKAYNGAAITPAAFNNHVDAENEPWVSEETENFD